jgi:hypothetical protein
LLLNFKQKNNYQMKKVFLSLSTAIAVLAVTTSLMTTTTSCKKDEVAPATVAGVVTVPAVVSVTSTTISLNNQFSASNLYYLISSNTFAAVNAAFDIAYGNGSATSNKYFIGGPNDESVNAVFPTTFTTTGTTFSTVSNFTSTQFDTLVNVKAIANVSLAFTGASSTGTSTRIKSETAWSVGYVFAFKTNAGKTVLAKVTSTPTGAVSGSAAGSVGLQLKY